jgi:hypothetical protein
MEHLAHGRHELLAARGTYASPPVAQSAVQRYIRLRGATEVHQAPRNTWVKVLKRIVESKPVLVGCSPGSCYSESQLYIN